MSVVLSWSDDECVAQGKLEVSQGTHILGSANSQMVTEVTETLQSGEHCLNS